MERASLAALALGAAALLAALLLHIYSLEARVQVVVEEARLLPGGYVVAEEPRGITVSVTCGSAPAVEVLRLPSVALYHCSTGPVRVEARGPLGWPSASRVLGG